MALGNSMVQRRIPRDIRCVQGRLVLEEELHHGDGSHSRGPVNRVLSAFISSTTRSRGLVVQKAASYVEVGLGRCEVQGGLVVEVCVGCEFWSVCGLAEGA